MKLIQHLVGKGPVALANGREQEVHYELLKSKQSLLVRLLMPMGVANLIIATMTAISFSHVVDPKIVWGWFSFHVVFSAVHIKYGYSFTRRPAPDKVSGGLLRKGQWLASFLGILWGVAIILFHSDNSTANILLYTVIGGMCAGTVAMTGPLTNISQRFMMAVVPWVLLGAGLYESDLAIGVLGTFLTLCFALVFGSKYTSEIFEAAVANGVENEKVKTILSESLDAAEDAFAVFDDKGKAVIVNKAHNEVFPSSENVEDFSESGMIFSDEQGRYFIRRRAETASGLTVISHGDVTVIRENEMRALAAERDAEEAAALKTRFLYALTTELLAPVRATHQLARLLSSGSSIQLDREQTEKLATNIEDATQFVVELIEYTIDQSQLEEFTEYTNITLQLGDALEDIVGVAEALERKSFDGRVEIIPSEKHQYISFNEVQLRRILIPVMCSVLRTLTNSSQLVIRVAQAAGDKLVVVFRVNGEVNLDKEFVSFMSNKTSEEDRKAFETSMLGGLFTAQNAARAVNGDLICTGDWANGYTVAAVLGSVHHLVASPPASHKPQQITGT